MRILEVLLDFIRSTPIPTGLRPTLYWLFRGSPLYLRTAALVVLSASLILGTVVWLNLSDTNRILVSALDAPWENTQLTHTGIEAFLLSSIVDDLTNSASSSSATQNGLNANFTNKLAEIQTKLTAFSVDGQDQTNHKQTSKKHSPAKASKAELDDCFNDVRPSGSQPCVEVYDANPRGIDLGSHLYLSDRHNGFLFVPGVATLHPDNLFTKPRNKGTALTRPEEPRLATDILMSQDVAPILCGEFQSSNQTAPFTSIFSDPAGLRDLSPHFSQTYIIFQSGVARLCESNVDSRWDEQRKYYDRQFTASTLLQDRPYFKETLADQNIVRDVAGNHSLQEVFHRTEPYIDLGGNGVVETFCRSLPIGVSGTVPSSEEGAGAANSNMNLRPYKSDAIVCLDFRLQSNIENTLLAKIKRFGGTAAIFTCDSQGCTQEGQSLGQTSDKPWSYALLSFFYPAAKFTSDDINHIKDKFADLAQRDERSQMTGRIGVDPEPAPSTAVLFSFPLGRSRLLAGKLDLRAYQTMSSFWITAFGVAAACTIILIVLILVDYGLKIKEQERAFEAVDTVMCDIPAPYARLDEGGKFAKVNEAFATETGFESVERAMQGLRSISYEELLADEPSRDTYRTIKMERKTGERYRSYKVRLWAGGGVDKEPKKEFEVHGWNVPTPRISRDKPGQSFGILLPVTSNVVPFSPKVSGAAG